MGDTFDNSFTLGVDEAGRGPLAGPVVAAAVILDENKPIANLRDSKKLSKKARESLFLEIKERAIFVSAAQVDVSVIDSINILKATFKAMELVVKKAILKHALKAVLVDGNTIIPNLRDVKQRAIKKGDTFVHEIMAASIIAKVHRDKIMQDYDAHYPNYGFMKHKGYGTKEHLLALKTYGPCPIHRKSFAPIKDIIYGA